LDIKGIHTVSDLIVAKKGDWVIEIRMSTATTVGTPEEGAKAVGDLVAPTIALIQALGTISTVTTSAQ